ncbi:NADPH-dependent FMN reductase [Membranihabitans maritimus]|uniref:NADPH-dependent FMN reductase n=1 Tax=Membranihabitans maritimus TaxID=2904244 RepID=UPI001F1A0AFF|nr:NAD(P)H-dependent oxidoreductase [Membranihabitans maritimus]
MKQKILAINGSASPNSSNLSILKWIEKQTNKEFEFEILDNLTEFPHFQTDRTEHNIPLKIQHLRKQIGTCNGIIICTPEYVFSIPSGLKNILEWCVSTTVLSDKPVGIITASTSGIKGHEELKLIMKTLQAVFTEETTLLIRGVKSKIKNDGNIIDSETEEKIKYFFEEFISLLSRKD